MMASGLCRHPVQVRASCASCSSIVSPAAYIPSARSCRDTRARLEVGANRNTVAKVYSELAREGLLNIAPGRGAFVVGRIDATAGEEPSEQVAQLLDDAVSRARLYGLTRDAVLGLVQERISAIYDGASPRMAFVECNPYDAQLGSGELTTQLGTAVATVLLSDIPSEERCRSTWRRPACSTSTRSNARSVRAACAWSRSTRCLSRMRCWPWPTCRSGAKVGIVAANETGVERFSLLVLTYCHAQIQSLIMPSDAALDKLVQWADVLVSGLSSAAQARRRADGRRSSCCLPRGSAVGPVHSERHPGRGSAGRPGMTLRRIQAGKAGRRHRCRADRQRRRIDRRRADRRGRTNSSVPNPEGAERLDFSDGRCCRAWSTATATSTCLATGQTSRRRPRRATTSFCCSSAENARITLQAGITTLRDNGARHRTTFSVKEAIRRKIISGPRLSIAGRPITMIGGHCWPFGGEANGVEGLRQAVRQMVKEGADWIKLMATGGGTANTLPYRPSFTVDELRAAVERRTRQPPDRRALLVHRRRGERARRWHRHDHSRQFQRSERQFVFDQDVARRIADQGVGSTRHCMSIVCDCGASNDSPRNAS